ncbi:MAG: hypothetical protein ACXAAI_09950, partial [Promethearchaeota archaeon]
MPNRDDKETPEDEEARDRVNQNEERESEEEKPEEKIHKLIVFEPKVTSKKKIYDKYSVEKSNQEEQITIINKLTPQGLHYSYSILINNQSPTLILSYRIRVLYSKFLEYSKCF